MNIGMMVKTLVRDGRQADVRPEGMLEPPARMRPAHRMLTVFKEAGTTHPEPLFYGLPISEYANRLRAIRFVKGRI